MIVTQTKMALLLYTKVIVSCLMPVTSLALSILVFHFLAHNPSRRRRILLFALYLCLSVLSFTSSKHFSVVSPGLTSLWAQSITLNIIHVTSLVFLERRPAPKRGRGQGIFSKTPFIITYRLWCNPQLLEHSSVLAERQQQRSKKAYKPGQNDFTPGESVHTFLLLRLLKIPLYYSLYTKLLPALFVEVIWKIEAFEVAPSRISLLSRLAELDAREVVVRAYTAVVWIWESLVVLDGANAVFAILFVLIGWDRPSDWPTIFSGPASACGLRNFWSKFWCVPFRVFSGA